MTLRGMECSGGCFTSRGKRLSSSSRNKSAGLFVPYEASSQRAQKSSLFLAGHRRTRVSESDCILRFQRTRVRLQDCEDERAKECERIVVTAWRCEGARPRRERGVRGLGGCGRVRCAREDGNLEDLARERAVLERVTKLCATETSRTNQPSL